ncbi:ImmA/IrrE family metallo-endopeptidase [Ornithinimicrobium sufpigmenti]|uniref:ImmA/IrrE family metallo-endopeptidase n=1 Tax=Ornithinimicrobium sufpigmenti TaxID=2508882 RepID=UPI0015E18EB1|nr:MULTISPECIES: ImmA/IrrE family metallo-endopeptidase [unclassified Ornithinimicrobium]
MSSYHPWRELRALTHVVVHWHELHPGEWGATDGRHRIWIDHRLGQAERRCTLAHELEHIRRGHRGCQPPAVEAVVEAAAARRLIPDPHALADALVWARGCRATAAEELWVDEPTLEARLDPVHLHPAERAILVARVEGLHTWH